MKKSKLCLLMLVMLLGASEVSNVVYAKDENKPVVTSEVNQDDVKANKEALEKAEQAMVKKDYQSAVVYLTAYINAKPKKYEAYKLRGDAFYALHQFKLAESDYQKAITLKTEDDKFVTGAKVVSAVVLGADKQSQYQNPELGNLYGRLMYAQKALNNPIYETTYEQAFKYNSHIYLPKPKKEDIAKINCPQKYGKLLNPQGVDEYIMDAISEIEDGQFHEAVYKIQHVTTHYPEYYLGHYLMGVAMVGLEQYDDAIHSFDTSLSLNPYDFETLASLGQLFYRRAEKTFSSDEAQKSIEYFTKAIKFNPNSNVYYYYIGLNNMIIGDYDSAISNFNTAIKLKANDYNSKYYKLVAQHIKGDYDAVIDGTTNLLYRHVSNYNSVLYLRALAYYRLGNNEAAMSDLEKVHNNMNDIYNDDIRPLSPKEQTLSNYLYYLKAQILQANGQGVKADLAKAYENPIIASLSKYKKDALGNVRLTARQVETEYDYIRTTFNDLNIGFTYLNPDYKLIALNPIQVDKVAEQGLSTMKKATDPVDMISAGQTSIAQMLATQSIGSIQSEPTPVGVEDFIKTQPDEEPTKAQEELAETVAQVEQVIEEVAKDDDYLQNGPVADEVVEKVIEEEKVAEEVVPEPEKVAEEIVEEVEEQQAEQVEEVVEKVAEAEEVVEEVVENVAEAKEVVGTDKEDVTEAVEEVQQVVKNKPIVEKHAKVDLNEFNTVQARKVLVLKADDEIIEFEAASLKDKVAPKSTQIITPITSSESTKISEEIVKNQQLTVDAVQQEVAKIDTISEVATADSVDVNVTKTDMTTKIAEVPAVVIPPVEVKLDGEDTKKQQEDVAPELEEVVNEVEDEVTVKVEKTLDEIVAPEIATVVNKPQKEKKSWFGWFKRDKKEKAEVVEETVENITEDLTPVEDVLTEPVEKAQEQVDEVKEVKEDVGTIQEEIVEVQKEVVADSQEVVQQVVNDADTPLIRTTKADIEEPEVEVPVVENKKKFNWWWKKDKPESVETNCLPEKKVKTKKIDWKKFFTPEPKSEIKVVEPENADEIVETELEDKVSE